MPERILEVAPGVASAVVICETGFALADVLGQQLLAMQGLTGKNWACPCSGAWVYF